MNNQFLINAFWLISEKFLTVIGGLFITIYTARYLGPDDMGKINYAIAIASIILPLSQLGNTNLLFDKFVKNRIQGVKLLLSSQLYRSGIYFICSSVFITYELIRSNDTDYFILIGILIAYYFSSIDSYRAYFDASLRAKVNVWSSQISLILAHSLRLVLVLISAKTYFFVLPFILNSAIQFLIKKYLFIKENSWVYDKRCLFRYSKFALKAGFPLALSGFSIAIYVRFNQIILANNVGMHEVGLYGAASLLSSGWSFLPMVMVTVGLTKVLSDRCMKDKGFSFIYLVTMIISTIIIFFISYFQNDIISVTFGIEYSAAKDILIILSFSTMFSIWGALTTRIIIDKGGYKYILFKTIFLAIFNVILSILLIQSFGLVGAAYSVLITEIMSATVSNYFFGKTSIARLQLYSFKSWGYALSYLK